MTLADPTLVNPALLDLRLLDLRLIMMLVAAAAVLAWPGAYSVGLASLVAGSSDRGQEADDAQADANANGGPFTAGVPAAEIAGVVDLLALTLRAGVGVLEAMEAVAARVGGPLGMHLRSVAAASRWGVDDATAWSSVPPAWQPAAMALRMAAAAGVPPADALRGAALEIRRVERQRLEMATATLGVRIVLPLGLVFLPAFILTTVMPIVIALARKVLVTP